MVKANETVKTMTCKACDVDCQRFGKHRNGLRRFPALIKAGLIEARAGEWRGGLRDGISGLDQGRPH